MKTTIISSIVGAALVAGGLFTGAQMDTKQISGAAIPNEADILLVKEERVCNLAEKFYVDRKYSLSDLEFFFAVAKKEYELPVMSEELGRVTAEAIMNSCGEYARPLHDAVTRVRNTGK